MRDTFLSTLVDPKSKQPLRLLSFDRKGDQIESGILQSDNSWYPLIAGVPRILTGALKKDFLQRHYTWLERWKGQLPEVARKEWEEAVSEIQNFDVFVKHLAKTGASFAYEWKNIYRENNFEKQNFLHFIGPYITESEIQGRTVLDVGCGSGRFTKQALACGAQCAIGVDVGESVDVAYALTKDNPNACIVQADVYDLPFQPIFDIVYSIGVLHHLPDPPAGFGFLAPVVKPGGLVAIWVYNRRGNKRALYLYEPVRSVMKRLPKPVVLALSYPPAILAHSLNAVTHYLNRWNAPRLAKKIPFSYYANFPFNMKLNDTFDVLATPKSNYYFVEEIERWFGANGYNAIRLFEHPEAGITAQGIKPTNSFD